MLYFIPQSKATILGDLPCPYTFTSVVDTCATRLDLLGSVNATDFFCEAGVVWVWVEGGKGVGGGMGRGLAKHPTCTCTCIPIDDRRQAQAVWQAGRQAFRQYGRQAGRQVGRQAGRQAVWQTGSRENTHEGGELDLAEDGARLADLLGQRARVDAVERGDAVLLQPAAQGLDRVPVRVVLEGGVNWVN